MAKRTGRRCGDEVRKLVLEQESSGLSVAAFSRERGVPSWTLYDWKRRLRKRKARDKVPDFVEVHIKPVHAAPSPIEVELKADVRVRVPAGFDANELRRVLEVLASC